MFASRTLVEHRLRGVVGLAALAVAVVIGPSHPVRAVALIPVALIALRGCPTCWLVGLVQTVAARLGGKPSSGSCRDGRCGPVRGAGEGIRAG